MRFKLRRPSTSTVLSLLALFVALGGSATAGVMITKSSQLGKNVVTGAKIKKGSISSSKLSKSAKAQLRGVGLKGLAGDKGATGETGSKGPQGDPGLDGHPGAKGADGQNGADGRNGTDGQNGTDGEDGDPGPPGPSVIALVGKIRIFNSMSICDWKQPNGYLVPEGQTVPSLSWISNGVCKLTFVSGSNVRWATSEADTTSSKTSWSKTSLDMATDSVYVSLFDLPATYGNPPVPIEGNADVVVYRHPE